MSVGWVSEKGRKMKFNDLLELYKIYQDRQKLDLDMHLRFANWYTVTLTALATASLLALGRYYESPYASLFVILPLLSIALIYQGKLATFRFYRRYTEGRARLTKIEHLWGLDGPICFEDSANCTMSRPDLWPLDRGFLPRRYFEQALQYKGSGDFIRGRARGYGIGAVTDRTLNLFLALSWLIVIFTPIALNIIHNRPFNHEELDLRVLAASVVVGIFFHFSYRTILQAMIGETPSSNIIAVDFDGTIADTLTLKHDWIKANLGKEIPAHMCDGSALRASLGEETYRKLFSQVFTRANTLGLKPLSGALNALKELRRMCQVIVVTARTGELLEAGREWLSKYEETRGLEILGVSEEFASKGDRCALERVELLIDDDPGHIDSAVAVHIDALLLKVDAPRGFSQMGREAIRSWEDVILRTKLWLGSKDRKLLCPTIKASAVEGTC